MNPRPNLQSFIDNVFKSDTLLPAFGWEVIPPLQEELSTVTIGATIAPFHAVVSLNPDMLTMTCKIITVDYLVVYYNHKKISAPTFDTEINKELFSLKEAIEYQILAP